MEAIATSNQIWYSNTTRYKYRLEWDLILQTSIRPPLWIVTDEFTISPTGELHIFKGYLWDGCSGPCIQRKENKRGSCGHDALAEAARQGLLTEDDKKLANQDLVRWFMEDGMWPWWAKNVIYNGVSLTNNWWRVTNKPEHRVIIAP
jgi:hypothetical protein